MEEGGRKLSESFTSLGLTRPPMRERGGGHWLPGVVFTRREGGVGERRVSCGAQTVRPLFLFPRAFHSNSHKGGGRRRALQKGAGGERGGGGHTL